MFDTSKGVFVRFYKDKLGNLYEYWDVNGIFYLFRQKDEKCVIANENMLKKLTKF